ncbi:B-cell receptor-associated protein 31-like isoform X2 [Hibiscus syriacus]|uniref:Endoplasmic reticulum transmembrane protein n=1 Tax=Hibiscus syriacus TaxID=106335 RepID=A0A6A2Z1P2_HIBSY|nr:B-cell receptor-associated protein 31-like isoform X2 [Hibiscus syriacus]
MAFLLLVKIGPLRELVIKSLDQLKTGKGPATVKTIAGTMFVILLSSLMSIVKIQNKGAKLGTMSPMDQVLWRTHLLEASLIGGDLDLKPKTFWRLVVARFRVRPLPWLPSLLYSLLFLQVFGYFSLTGLVLVFVVPMNLHIHEQLRRFTLFLGFMIDRMHHYITKLVWLRSRVGSSKEEVERLEKERSQLKDKENKTSKEIKLLKEEISTLSDNLKKLRSESEEKDKKIETAEAHIDSLQKQSADLLLEYDRLLEDNQNLQNHASGYKELRKF